MSKTNNHITIEEKQTAENISAPNYQVLEALPEKENEPLPSDGSLPNVWVYDGQAYDLTKFIRKHPGGEFFVRPTKNRDITTFVNFFHNNPERVRKVLAKYSLERPAKPEDVHPTYWAPEFLFSKGFNRWRDRPKYNFKIEKISLNLPSPHLIACTPISSLLVLNIFIP